METQFERYHPDDAALSKAQGRSEGVCFVCNLVAQHDAGESPVHIVYEDEATIAFLDPYPRRYGYTLVAPREHRVLATGDFTLQEYLDLHRIVYGVSEAVRREVGAERMYILTLGSNQGNAHVHWHVVPLPPGIPFEQQQNVGWPLGVLRIPDPEMASLAARLGLRLREDGNSAFQEGPFARH